MLDLVLPGVLVILAGLILIVVSVLTSREKRGEGMKGGGVVLIGPIPIVFGSDAKWASIAIVLTIVLVILVLLGYLV